MAALAAALATALAACTNPDAPILTAFACERPEDCQSLTDPFLLEMEVRFSDRNSDLGDGTYQLFLDDDLLGPRSPMSGLFDAAGLGLGAVGGTVPVDVPLELNGVVSGKEFEVAIEVTDAAGHDSNRPGVLFRLDLN